MNSPSKLWNPSKTLQYSNKNKNYNNKIMERKLLKIQPFAMTGGPHKKMTFQAYILFDNNLKRKVTIQGPYHLWGKRKWDPDKLQSLFKNYIFQSGIPYYINREEFLDMSFKPFTKITITNELI